MKLEGEAIVPAVLVLCFVFFSMRLLAGDPVVDLLCVMAGASRTVGTGLHSMLQCSASAGTMHHCGCVVQFMLASGEVFGQNQPIALQLLGSERSAQALEGVAMELEDSLYPLLREVGLKRCTDHVS